MIVASGTPTVVTVHGGLYRALSFGRHALFADPFDKEDLGITIAKIFRHPRLRGPPQLWHQGREGESREAISIAERQLRQVYIVSPLSKQVILRCDRLENDQAPRMHHSESVDFNRRKLGDDREHPVEDPPLVAIGRALRRDQIDDNFGGGVTARVPVLLHSVPTKAQVSG